MDKIIVLDFGGQYKQLIARRVRELGVYCEILPYTTPLEELKRQKPQGIILTGGPASVYLEESPSYDAALFDTGIPILGICYGAPLMAIRCGGPVKTAPVSEYGHAELIVGDNSGRGCPVKRLLDEPYGLYRRGAGGLYGHRAHVRLSGGGDGERGQETLRCAVPSRGCPFGRGNKDPEEFRH